MTLPAKLSAAAGQMRGTRSDLAAYLRKNRRTLKLFIFDTMKAMDENDCPAHIFCSRLDRAPYHEHDIGFTRFMFWTITPF